MAAAAEAYSMASRDLAKELRFGGVERLVRAESYHATSYPPYQILSNSGSPYEVLVPHVLPESELREFFFEIWGYPNCERNFTKFGGLLRNVKSLANARAQIF